MVRGSLEERAVQPNQEYERVRALAEIELGPVLRNYFADNGVAAAKVPGFLDRLAQLFVQEPTEAVAGESSAAEPGDAPAAGGSVIERAGWPSQKGGQLWPAERAALDALILARYFRGMSRAAIARELGIPVQRVNRRLATHGQSASAKAAALGMRLKWDRATGSYQLVPPKPPQRLPRRPDPNGRPIARIGPAPRRTARLWGAGAGLVLGALLARAARWARRARRDAEGET